MTTSAKHLNIHLEQCVKEIFERLWHRYTTKVPEAKKIESALRVKGDVWNEDHVAFRTLPGSHTGRHALGKIFETLGYQRREELLFEDKQLTAAWYEPPRTANRHTSDICPKIFISELIPDKFSPKFQETIRRYACQVTATPLRKVETLSLAAASGDADSMELLVDECVQYLSAGPAWARPSYADYELLRAESEFAAWTLLFGGEVNHFTLSAHLMETFHSLQELNDFIQGTLRIPMNETGGLTKGSKALRLEQSSTLAAMSDAIFQEGIQRLPYAFVEFAFRHPLEGKKADGLWHSYFQGFYVKNADKIFDSTNRR